MEQKPTALQLAMLWAVTSLLVTACGGTSSSCDDPRTPAVESCGTSHAIGGYYRSGGSSYVRGVRRGTGGNRAGVGTSTNSGRSGFGKTGSGRSGFG
jgi:hypothetical protein